MQKETKECAIQEIPDDVKQWLESHRQPFNKMLKDIYDDLFQKEFQKRLMWKDDTLWYGDPDQGTMYSVPDLAGEIRNTQKYDELVGPRGGLDSRNRGKEGGKGLAILLLEQGYLLQESMDREVVEPLEQELGRFLEEHKADNVDRKGVILAFKQMFVKTMYKKLMRNSELLQNTDRMLLRRYLEPAFESLKSDLMQPDGSVHACAVELLPVISERVSGKTTEELEGFSRNATVVKVLLQNLINEYFLTVIEG